VTEQEKLRVMLGHWIEHNREHAAEFLRWVERAGEAAADLHSAAAGMEESSRCLARALERLGGPLSAGTAPPHQDPAHPGPHEHEHPHGH
jgi:hypothetical protein